MKSRVPAENFPPIFVISLARATERRADMICRLDLLGVNYEIVDAVDGKELDLSALGNRLRQDICAKNYGRKMNIGEIGCYLSHYNLWERMVADNISTAIVLEDDAALSEDFASVVSDTINCEYEWEIVDLYSNKPAKIYRTLCFVGENRKLGISLRSHLCTVGYLIRRSAAEKLVSYCREIREPIDMLFVRWWRHKTRYYYVSPSPTKQFGHESIIGFEKKPKGFYASFCRKRERFCLFLASRLHKPKKRQK